MSRRFAFAVAWLLLTLLIAGGAAAYAYHLGTLATVSAAAGGGYVMHPYFGYWGWGFGFFPFGFLFPLLFILLIVWLIRPRRWHADHHGGFERRQAMFEEWHRQAHADVDRPARSDEPPKST